MFLGQVQACTESHACDWFSSSNPLVGVIAIHDPLVSFVRATDETSALHLCSVSSGASRALDATMLFFRMCTGLSWLFISVITVLSLCANLSLCQDTLATRMRVISEDLDRQLNEMMASQAVSYSIVNTTGLLYNASTKFNPMGMGQLYNVTNMFIDFVQSKQAYPEGESKNQFIKAS